MSDSNSINPALLSRLGIDSKTVDTKPRNELGQTEFFELMITQMQNQDPLNPADSNEFIGQIAQFSAVSGLTDVQQSIDAMSRSFQSNQALQATTLVGRDVLIPASNSRMEANNVARGAIELDQPTKNMSISIFDGSGQQVKTIELGRRTAGTVEFNWDGVNENGERVADGIYSFTANVEVEGETYAATILMKQRVDSVSLGRNGASMELNLNNGATIGIDQIKKLL